MKIYEIMRCSRMINLFLKILYGLSVHIENWAVNSGGFLTLYINYM